MHSFFIFGEHSTLNIHSEEDLNKVEIIQDSFSFIALLFSGIWLLYNRLWGTFLLYVSIQIIFKSFDYFYLNILLHFCIALFSADLLCFSKKYKGLKLITIIRAIDKEHALQKFLTITNKNE